MTESEFVKHLIKRLARLDAEDGWRDALNPAQQTVLEYLSQANRFSRRPSHVAEFMGSTRGTISQTLKSLSVKGYITEEKSESDRRSISYKLTDHGHETVSSAHRLDHALETFHGDKIAQLAGILQTTLHRAIEGNDQKPFGVCKHCQHFKSQRSGGHCQLLNVALDRAETNHICFEQVPA